MTWLQHAIEFPAPALSGFFPITLPRGYASPLASLYYTKYRCCLQVKNTAD